MSGVTARPAGHEAAEVAIGIGEEDTSAAAGERLAPAPRPQDRVQLPQWLIGHEPAVGHAPRSHMERGDRVCVLGSCPAHHQGILPPVPEARIIRLRDGRRLAYDDVGDPRGAPLLYFHGGGDSRLTRHPDDAIAEQLGIRLIAVDRPGCGRSDFRRCRSLAEWAADVDEVADALELGRFAVLGWSAGGPHALACARILRDRVERAAVVAGMPEPASFALLPRDLHLTLRLARRDPRLAFRVLTRWSRRPTPQTGDADCDPAYAAGRVEAFRQGSRGLAWELHMLTRQWGFLPEEIRVPVSLWYGARDRVCPPAIGVDLERRIPAASLTVVEDGHQLLFTRWREILTELRGQS